MSASILATFNLGPQITASIIGSPYQQYRPQGANNPTASGNLIRSINAWITADDKAAGSKAFNYGKPVMFGMFDPTVTAVGDYLVGPLGTFFIASQDVPAPMQIVRCSHTLNLSEPGQAVGFGKQEPYGGDQRATENVLASAWPASVVQGSRGEGGTSRLPGDTRMPWFVVLLPAISGVTIRNNLILTDENGLRYVISSFETSALGWRLTALLATT